MVTEVQKYCSERAQRSGLEHGRYVRIGNENGNVTAGRPSPVRVTIGILRETRG